MHTIGIDLLELWLAAIVLLFAILFFSALSIDDRQNRIFSGGSAVLVLGTAIVVTIGLFVGFVGVW